MIIKTLIINILLSLDCFYHISSKVEQETPFKITEATIVRKNNQIYFLISNKGKEFLLSDRGGFYYYDLGVLRKQKLSLHIDSKENDIIERIFYHSYKDNIILYCHGDSNAQPIMFISSVNILKNQHKWMINVYNTMSSTVYYTPPNIGKVLVGRFNLRFNLDNGKTIN
ncbi:MAG: hypothetical protein ACOVQA_15460 [Thermoflexibacteraceae bacterium]|jgi:hypothetical protein